MQIKIKKLHENAVIPTKAHNTDAGFDLTAITENYDDDTHTIVYGTGLSIEIPEGYVGYLFPRSSIYRVEQALCNSIGVIDSKIKFL